MAGVAMLPIFAPVTWSAWWTALVSRFAAVLPGPPNGLIGHFLSESEYAKISSTPFAPAKLPTGDGATGAHRFLYKKYVEEQQALQTIRTDIIASVDIGYLRAVPGFDPVGTGIALVPPKAIVDHLRATYGKPTAGHVSDATAELEAMRYDPSEAIPLLIGRALACHATLKAAGQPLPELQKIGYLARAVESADPMVAKQAINYHMKHPDTSTVTFEEYADKVRQADAAVAALGPRMSSVGTQRADAAHAIPCNQPNPSSSHLDKVMTGLAEIRAIITDHPTTRSAAAVSDTRIARAPRTGAGPPQQGRRQRGAQYCWTHGQCAHTSSDCRERAPQHRPSATAANTLGGAPADRRARRR